jgi:hypothetical protein
MYGAVSDAQLPFNQEELRPCLLHQHQFQTYAWSSNQTERKSKERIRDALTVPLVQPDEVIEDIQIEAVHLLDEMRDDLTQAEEEEEEEEQKLWISLSPCFTYYLTAKHPRNYMS